MQREPNIDERSRAETGIPGTTRMGSVHLSAVNLDRQIEFYQKVIGFKLHWRDKGTAGLGAGGEDLLRLTERPGAHRYKGHTGIYHFAILLPERKELARVVARLFSLHYPNYPTDHVMTKTTYLDDPEGNTIEIYVESPEDGMMGFVDGEPVARHADGRPSNGREALDLEALFGLLSAEDALDQVMPAETKIGHVHLYVASLQDSLHFYHDLIGFDSMGVSASMRIGMVSAGGYHHHVGFNTWVGEGAPPAPPDAIGLFYFTVVLPDSSSLEQVTARLRAGGAALEELDEGWLARDPSGNPVRLISAG